jgi:hypothetical protein
MRITRTILEVEVTTFSPWTGPLFLSAELYYRKNLDCLQLAVGGAVGYAPGAIWDETGQGLEEILKGILDGLIISGVVLSASTALGATIGGIIGFFFGGAGALPGAALGAKAGFDLGLLALEVWGLKVLVEHVGSSLGDVISLIAIHVKQAWEAGNQGTPQREILIDSAAHGLARAVGKLFRLVLEGIVLFLLAKGAAKLGELTGQLKASRLGKGFGEWVERNWQKLLDDPRFNPRLRPKAKAAGGNGAAGEGDAGPRPPLSKPKTAAELQAEERARLEQKKEQLRKERSENLKEKARQDLVKRCEQNSKKLSEADRKWLEEDPTGRRKVLAADPGPARFKVQEAKAALQAEADGSLTPPVTRDVTEAGGETGRDFVDGAGKTWDHITGKPDPSLGADDIMDKALPETPGAQGENVLVDCSNLTPEQQAALQTEVGSRPKPPGTGDIIYVPKR